MPSALIVMLLCCRLASPIQSFGPSWLATILFSTKFSVNLENMSDLKQVIPLWHNLINRSAWCNTTDLSLTNFLVSYAFLLPRDDFHQWWNIFRHLQWFSITPVLSSIYSHAFSTWYLGTIIFWHQHLDLRQEHCKKLQRLVTIYFSI
jgi:hypothetical protein